MPEQAAVEAGIPLEEAKTWLAERRDSAAYDDDSLRVLAASALQTGVDVLTRIAQEKDGRIKNGGGEFSETIEYHDTDAAKALLNAGLKLRAMLGVGKRPVKGGQPDLFDGDESDTGPWSFPVSKL